MTNKTLATGNIASIDPELIYTCPATISSCSLLPLLLVNKSDEAITIKVFWNNNLGGAEIIIPAGIGKWRHMVGIPLGMSGNDSISIQSSSAEPFDYHLGGTEL